VIIAIFLFDTSCGFYSHNCYFIFFMLPTATFSWHHQSPPRRGSLAL